MDFDYSFAIIEHHLNLWCLVLVDEMTNQSLIKDFSLNYYHCYFHIISGVIQFFNLIFHFQY